MNKQTPRYAHEDGLVSLSLDEKGERIITGGVDGDVRIFAGFDDDDTITHRAGDSVYAVGFQNEQIYVASDDNAVKIMSVEDGQSDGLLTRFTAPVTCISFSLDKKTIVAGSRDFTVKLITEEDKSQKQLTEHEAPVLSVAIHPHNTYVASSSCDGTIHIYETSQEKVTKKLVGFVKSNDITTAKSLCRICWNRKGEYLMVPKEKEIIAYSSSTWDIAFTLTESTVSDDMSIACLSRCGGYLAAATRDGAILIFDLATRRCINQDQHNKKVALCGLAWGAHNDLVWVDVQGQLGLFEHVLPSGDQGVSAPVISAPAARSQDALDATQLEELFDDVDDDMLVQASAPATAQSDSEEDDLAPSMNRSRVTRIQDDDEDDAEDNMDTDQMKADVIDKILEDDDNMSTVSGAASALVPPAPATTVVQGFEPTPMQRPFQPASSPAHCAHRFMKWNSVGIIVQYNTEEENSINIEFHDSATHHALHVTNSMGHTMADLSHEAVLLACEADEDEEDTASKLVCMHFSSWDNSKEWSTSMPKGEEIKAITLGEGWCAVGTDRRMVRVFSVGGVQRDVLSVPGPVVALAGYMHQLLIVYHRAMALPGDQCLGVRLLHVTGRKRTVLAGEDLPLTHKSTLTWVGFSAEGTPFAVDSHGIVRMLNRGFGNNWIQVANLKKHSKGKSDNYWVVGIHENPQQIRAILCKGARFPPTLPRPNVNVLSFEIPLCEMATDKGAMEEGVMRAGLMSEHFAWWGAQGFEYDEHAKTRAAMPKQEALMKLFALACKTERELRAVEVCEMMPSSHTVQLAIKYASRLRLLGLAGRLGDVARAKCEAEQSGEHEASDEEEAPPAQPRVQVSEEAAGVDEVDEDEDGQEEEEDEQEEEGDIVEQVEAEQLNTAPALKINKDTSSKQTAKAPTLSQTAKMNPFKVGAAKTPSSTGAGSKVFDSMEKHKPPSRSPFESLQKKTKVLRKPRAKGSSQTSIFGKASAKANKTPEKESSSEAAAGRTGFELWYAEHEAALQEEHPELSTADLTITAAKTFKQLSPPAKQEWEARAAQDERRKRKREQDEDTEDTENQPSKSSKKHAASTDTRSASSKLQAFSFTKSS